MHSTFTAENEIRPGKDKKSARGSKIDMAAIVKQAFVRGSVRQS